MTVTAPSLSGGHGPCTSAKSCSVMKIKDEFDTKRTGDSRTWKECINKAVRKLCGASGDILTPRHGPSVTVMPAWSEQTGGTDRRGDAN